jgi:hypothetical protein
LQSGSQQAIVLGVQYILNIELLDSKYVHARYGRSCLEGQVSVAKSWPELERGGSSFSMCACCVAL